MVFESSVPCGVGRDEVETARIPAEVSEADWPVVVEDDAYKGTIDRCESDLTAYLSCELVREGWPEPISCGDTFAVLCGDVA